MGFFIFYRIVFLIFLEFWVKINRKFLKFDWLVRVIVCILVLYLVSFRISKYDELGFVFYYLF